MTPRRSIPIALTALGAAATLAAGAGVPRVLIDRKLERKPVELLRLDNGVIVYDDAAGLRRTERWDSYVALLDTDSAIQRPDEPDTGPNMLGDDFLARAFQRDVSIVTFDDRWILETTDGQRLFGTPLEGGEGSLWWRADDHGDGEAGRSFGIPLERVDRLAPLRFGLPDERAATQDAVTLVNGDRVTGFVERIGATVAIDSDIGPVEAPIERVTLIDLANPPEPGEGLVLWLNDGTVVRAEGLHDGARPGLAQAVVIDRSIGRDTSESESPVSPTPTALREVAAIAFDRAAFTPLSSLETESQRSLGLRRWFEPAEIGSGDFEPLGAGDVRLPGPMEVRWVLPVGASRLAFDAELPLEARTWGDCDLVVLLAASENAEPEELSRTRLNGRSPVARVNVELADPDRARRRLIVRLEPGDYGPIQDEVVIRTPLLAAE